MEVALMHLTGNDPRLVEELISALSTMFMEAHGMERSHGGRSPTAASSASSTILPMPGRMCMGATVTIKPLMPTGISNTTPSVSQTKKTGKYSSPAITRLISPGKNSRKTRSALPPTRQIWSAAVRRVRGLPSLQEFFSAGNVAAV